MLKFLFDDYLKKKNSNWPKKRKKILTRVTKVMRHIAWSQVHEVQFITKWTSLGPKFLKIMDRHSTKEIILGLHCITRGCRTIEVELKLAKSK